MTDKSLVLALPEDLLNRAQAAQLDLRQVFIEALEKKLPHPAEQILPSLEDIQAAIEESRRRIASGEAELRILGLHAGTSWISDDFDDPLPDEFWLNGNP